ncbi:unnamed protein product, partial [Notodromas monacha]
MWDVGIDVTLTVERALRAQLNSLINSSRDTLLESIRGRWRIPEREAASGKPHSDAELRKLAEEDRNNLKLRGEELTRQALEILTFCKTADTDEILLEVSAGVGGQEAMLFAGEIFEMYQTFAESRGWSVEINAKDNSDIGGLRSGIAEIRGPGAYNMFKYEGGIHRVQRVPATEKSGRVHTSTVSVAILPVFAD